MPTPPFEIKQESSGMHSPHIMSMEVELMRILYWVIKARQYKSIVEIGVFEGHSSWWLYQAILGVQGRLYLVDPQIDTAHVESLLRPEENKVRMYRGPSEDFFNTYEKGKKFDLIVIDGDHSEASCHQDFSMSVSALSLGGMIVIHDTVIWPGVRLAMENLYRDYEGTWMRYPCGKGFVFYEPKTEWEAR